MRLKELQSELEGLRVFDEPKVQLEQSQMIFAAESSYGDIEGRSVLDLGVGCGMLSIAARVAGAAFVLGVDIDEDALQIANENLDDMEMQEEVDLLQAAVTPRDAGPSPLDRLEGCFNTVLMNPPFGTKTAGIDMVFLERACRIASCAVYSLHKSSTRDYIKRRARDFGFDADVLAQMRYDLPKTMRFHRDKSKDIAVDFWRFSRLKQP